MVYLVVCCTGQLLCATLHVCICILHVGLYTVCSTQETLNVYFPTMGKLQDTTYVERCFQVLHLCHKPAQVSWKTRLLYLSKFSYIIGELKAVLGKLVQRPLS